MADERKEIFRQLYGRRRGPQTFRLGDTVRILSGPFAAFNGRVEGINQAKRLLKVKVEIFGVEAPIRLEFAEAETVSSS
jgi:transcriptional antiterminator NusG